MVLKVAVPTCCFNCCFNKFIFLPVWGLALESFICFGILSSLSRVSWRHPGCYRLFVLDVRVLDEAGWVFEAKILRKMMKKWFIPNRLRIIPASWPELQDIKTHAKTSNEVILELPEKTQIFDENLSFWWLFGPKICIFAMLTHVLPCGRPRG